jgi:hypothetical protein
MGERGARQLRARGAPAIWQACSIWVQGMGTHINPLSGLDRVARLEAHVAGDMIMIARELLRRDVRVLHRLFHRREPADRHRVGCSRPADEAVWPRPVVTALRPADGVGLADGAEAGGFGLFRHRRAGSAEPGDQARLRLVERLAEAFDRIASDVCVAAGAVGIVLGELGSCESNADADGVSMRKTRAPHRRPSGAAAGGPASPPMLLLEQAETLEFHTPHLLKKVDICHTYTREGGVIKATPTARTRTDRQCDRQRQREVEEASEGGAEVSYPARITVGGRSASSLSPSVCDCVVLCLTH